MSAAPGQARAGSIEAVDAFRAHLVVYLARAGAVLEEVEGDLQRARMWLEGDRRVYWEQERRRRARKLEETQAALFSARLSAFGQGSAVQQADVLLARRSLEEAEEKLRRIRAWVRGFDSRTEALRRQLHSAESYLGHDMAQAVASLSETVRLLQAYADVAGTPAKPEAGA